MNHAARPKEASSRAAFKDVSNRFDAECSKHAKAIKKRKMPGGSKLANNNKKGLSVSSRSCESKKSGAVVKKAPPRAISKSSQSKLPPSTKETSAQKTTCKHYQDGPAHDIDKRDSDDPIYATSYIKDMYTYYREQEHRAVVDPLIDQTMITPSMRAILIDWLCEVHLKSKMEPETLYITVNILDRYLSVASATRKNLQLIGTSSLLIASKYEEIYPVDLGDLVYVCDKAYSRDEVLDMEHMILNKLNYQISIPSIYKFLVRFLNAGHSDRTLCYLASYILEESLLSYDMIKKYKPSQLAAAAVLIGRKAIGRNAWSPTLLRYSEYREEDIIPIANDMIEAKKVLCPQLRAIKKKYTSIKYGRVARSSKFDGTNNIVLPSDK